MAVRRSLRDEEAARDLAVGESVGHQPGDLPLAGGEPGCRVHEPLTHPSGPSGLQNGHQNGYLPGSFPRCRGAQGAATLHPSAGTCIRRNQRFKEV